MFYHNKRTKGKFKSCRICTCYKDKFCNAHNITISSLNNATHCSKFNPNRKFKNNFSV